MAQFLSKLQSRPKPPNEHSIFLAKDTYMFQLCRLTKIGEVTSHGALDTRRAARFAGSLLNAQGALVRRCHRLAGVSMQHLRVRSPASKLESRLLK